MSREGEVSVPTDTLDSLVQAASAPSLSTLFRKAKDDGLIAPVSTYGEGAGGNQSTTTSEPPF
jgi:hypothetical protein